ncbi:MULTISPECIES: hypothetical protein [Nostocales]|jgi:hypothetical protein|uniref:Uncharacterized protein n=1 Tax=Dolichospermum flos-aquae UHCC 0037 TaxID=2590026 RepID=A0ACC7S796_DOLFA|nr:MULTISPECIES: hypothetical protein [Nostocales]MBO1067785.1 hypothetical protein [Anabaena sp. 54]MTJ44191.1 hypothetical protein [Dolichospermum flos-aquae UHCC 0037]OBQ15736.1 MAG: hypothetical protein AN486_22025 [Anabaena sp. AL93]
MVEPLTGAVIVSLFFSEAIKEGGKFAVKGVADTFAKLVSSIRQKLTTEGMEGLLIRAEKDPTEKNKTKLQDELQEYINADATFANQLKLLVEELKTQDPKIRQVILSGIELTGDLQAQNITQKTSGSSGSVDQEMLTNIKANNINVGDLTQEG